MIITLYPTNCAVTFLEDGHTRTLTPENPEDNTAQSDLTDVSPLVKEMCQSLWAIPRNESGRKVQFNSDTCTIQAGSDKITPDTDLSEFPEEVRVFAETIFNYAPDPDTREPLYAEMWRLSQIVEKGDEPDEPIMKRIPVYDAEGKNIVDHIEEPETEMVEEPAIVKTKEGQLRRVIKEVPRPVMRPGKKVPDEVKERLEVLRKKDADSQ